MIAGPMDTTTMDKRDERQLVGDGAAQPAEHCELARTAHSGDRHERAPC